MSDRKQHSIKLKKNSKKAYINKMSTKNNFTQKDLFEIGSQGVVSEILNGKRELNIRQIRILAQKFNISPSVFI